MKSGQDWTFEGFHPKLDALAPRMTEKAVSIAQDLMEKEGLSEEDALNEGIKRAGEWFCDLEA